MVRLTDRPLQLYFVRHGETEWSARGLHTGVTDLPLTAAGTLQASRLAVFLSDIKLIGVFTSPLTRARQTCETAGFANEAIVDADLAEWDYGEYEGRTTADIHRTRPGWDVFKDGCPGGEEPAQIAQRVDRVIARQKGSSGSIALFSHGQFGCALAARWIGLPVSAGRNFALDPTAIGILGTRHDRPETPVILRWNVLPGEV